VAKGEILGYIEIRNNGAFAGRVNVVASKDVAGAKGGTRQTSKRDDTGSARSGIAQAAGDRYVGGDGPGDAIFAGAGGAVAAGANGDGTGNGGAGGDGGANGGDGGAGGGASGEGGANGGAAGANGSGAGGSGDGSAGGSGNGSGAARASSGTGASGNGGGNGQSKNQGSQSDGKSLPARILMISFLVVVSLAALISAVRTINKIRASRRAQFSGGSMERRQIPMRPYGGQPGGAYGLGANQRRAPARRAGDGRAAAPARIGRPFGGQYGAKDNRAGRQ
jgi:hypothetical protein